MASPTLKLRATKTPGEGWPICEVGSGWWLESDGMRASDMADAIDSGLGGYEGLTKVLALAPSLAADLARVTAERDAARADAARYKARLDDYYDDHRAVVAGRCGPDEVHCSCVPHLRREVEAMRAVVEAAERASMCITCSRDRGYMAPHKKCRSCASCKAAATLKSALDALRTRKGGG